jgi:transposase
LISQVGNSGEQHQPHAIVVADHFHGVRLANEVLAEVRRRATFTARGRRGRASNRDGAPAG